MNKVVVAAIIGCFVHLLKPDGLHNVFALSNEQSTIDPVLWEEEATGETLVELYKNFTSLFDSQEIQEYIQMKNETDPEFNDLLVSIDQYLRADGAKTIVNYIWNDYEFSGVIEYFYNHGFLKIYENLNKINRKYGYNLIKPAMTLNSWKVKGFVNMKKVVMVDRSLRLKNSAPIVVQEFLDTLPLEQVRKFLMRISNVPAGKSLYARLSARGLWTSYRQLNQLSESTSLGIELRRVGFEIDTLRHVIEMTMTWDNYNSAVQGRMMTPPLVFITITTTTSQLVTHFLLSLFTVTRFVS